MSTVDQNRSFTEAIMQNWPLDEAIRWINDNLAPDEVFDERILEGWAENNGWVIPDNE